jgi:acetyl esterase/lipase
MLHVHVRDPATGQGSVNFDQFNYFLERLKKAVPKMILQVGGSISFAPHTAEAKAKWLDYDTRHMLAELEPKPEFVTVATGTTQWDIMSMMLPEDIKGTHLENNPKVQAAWSGMWVDAGPAFYLEHLKRLHKNRIQPYFVPAHVHQLELIERVIRAGVYMGPMNLALAGYGGGTLGRNPYHWMDFLRQVPQGAVATFWTSMRGLISLAAMAIVLGQHVRVGNEDRRPPPALVAGKAKSEPLLKRYEHTVEQRELGGVPVLDVRPKEWKDDGRAVVYTHGGAHVMYSAASTLGRAVVAAHATRLRVISVDYTLAPHAKYNQMSDQVVAAIQALLKQGQRLADTAIYGDSSGGGLAAAVVLKMRDRGLGMPAAALLVSAWLDVAPSGDTETTLHDADPNQLYEKHGKYAAAAFADPKDQKDPRTPRRSTATFPRASRQP